VERFNSAGGGRAELLIDVDPHVVPREPSALAYRLVVESLTNVRRHASRGTRVDVSVTALDGPGIRVSVRDTGPARRTATTRSSGTGITGLRARVEALGGALSAGPAGSGWALESSLPFSPGGDG
jgi:signal transduction histidine kinase